MSRLIFRQWASHQQIPHPSWCSRRSSSLTASVVLMRLCGQRLRCVKTKLLLATTATDKTVVAIDVLLTACGWCAYRFKTKLLFAAIAVDKTLVAIHAFMDGNYTVMKERSQCSVMRHGKRKNKGYKGTNRHEALRSCHRSRTISTDGYGDADTTTSFQLDASSVLALSRCTFAVLCTRQAPSVVQISE